MASEQTWAWDGDEGQFPSDEVHEWEFFTNPSDEQNNSDTLASRCDPELARNIDEIVLVGKGYGIPLKTRSDFVRWACARSLKEFQKYIGEHSESLSHYMLKQQQVQREAQNNERLSNVRTNSKRMGDGIQVIMKDRTPIGMREAVTRITRFLTPIMELAGNENYLMRLYVKEFFGQNSIQSALKVLKKADEEKVVTLGAVITNAARAYERISAENQ